MRCVRLIRFAWNCVFRWSGEKGLRVFERSERFRKVANDFQLISIHLISSDKLGQTSKYSLVLTETPKLKSKVLRPAHLVRATRRLEKNSKSRCVLSKKCVQSTDSEPLDSKGCLLKSGILKRQLFLAIYSRVSFIAKGARTLRIYWLEFENLFRILN